MKYQCVSCKEIFDADKIITVGINTGWNFFTSTVFCNSCFELYEKSKKCCADCKYYNNPTRRLLYLTEPCKSCKNNSNWEQKPCKDRSRDEMY